MKIGMPKLLRPKWSYLQAKTGMPVDPIEIGRYLSNDIDETKPNWLSPKYENKQKIWYLFRDFLLNSVPAIGLFLIVGFVRSAIVYNTEDSRTALIVSILALFGSVAAFRWTIAARRKERILSTSELLEGSRNHQDTQRALKLLSNLKQRKVSIYIRYETGNWFKLPTNLWNGDEFILYLLGSPKLRRAIQPDSKKPCERLYIDRIETPKKGKTKTGKNSRFCPHVQLLLNDKKSLDEYVKLSKNWNDKNHRDFRGNLSDPHQKYHNTLLFVHENWILFRQWIDGQIEINTVKLDFERQILKHLGIESSKHIPILVNEFRSYDHRAMENYLKSRNFIDKSRLPKRLSKPNKTRKKETRSHSIPAIKSG